jgi:hypothetical protein
MSLTVRDASLITQRNRNKAVNAYAQSFRSAVGSGVQGLTAPGAAGAESVTEAKLGCTACAVYQNELVKAGIVSGTPDTNLSLYPFNPSSGGAGRTY